jgi:hypothetical protein
MKKELPESEPLHNLLASQRYLGGAEHPAECGCGKCQSFHELFSRAVAVLKKTGKAQKLTLGGHTLVIR